MRIAILIVLLTGLMTPAAHAQAERTLTVFAAASLTDAFQEIAQGFETANPDVTVQISFAGSSNLALQLVEGAPADVFASANNRQMQVVRDAERLTDAPQTFAKNRLVLIVPSDNPAGIQTLEDVASGGVLLVVAAEGVPVRDYTNTMLDNLAAVYGEDFRSAVMNNIVSEEENVRQVAAKVALGEADAGFVYVSDVTPDIADDVMALPIPDTFNTIATYPIGAINDTEQPELAQAFIDYVLSDEGQDTLVRWNLISVRIPPVSDQITLSSDGTLRVEGQVYNPLTLTPADLENTYISQTVEVTYQRGEEMVTTSFTGVLLWDIVGSAQPNLNADVANDKLSFFVVASGSDGQQALISWGEIDPDFGNQPILVAFAENGQAITDEEGALRLIVPGDLREGRYVGGLTNLSIRDAPSIGG